MVEMNTAEPNALCQVCMTPIESGDRCIDHKGWLPDPAKKLSALIEQLIEDKSWLEKSTVYNKYAVQRRLDRVEQTKEAIDAIIQRLETRTPGA